MSFLISLLSALAVLCSFASGFLLGRAMRSRPLLPVEPAVPDTGKQREFEAEQKALADCLNYSIDVAYGRGGS